MVGARLTKCTRNVSDTELFFYFQLSLFPVLARVLQPCSSARSRRRLLPAPTSASSSSFRLRPPRLQARRSLRPPPPHRLKGASGHSSRHRAWVAPLAFPSPVPAPAAPREVSSAAAGFASRPSTMGRRLPAKTRRLRCYIVWHRYRLSVSAQQPGARDRRNTSYPPAVARRETLWGRCGSSLHGRA